VFHDERHDITAFSATETFEQSFRRRHRKRRRFFVMERTSGDEIHAATSQSDEIADNINDIGNIDYFLYRLRVNHASVTIFL
jgi:hypothetical protein